MKRLILLSVLAIVLSLTFGLYPNNAKAEDIEYQTVAYITKADFIPVPDVEKHAVGIYERRGVAIFKNGETAEYHTRGTFDFVDSNGPFQGYSTLTYKDGSITITKYTGTMSKESGKLQTYSGKGEYIKGTGKYEGIKGNLSFDAVYVTPYNKETQGDAVLNVKGTYTLPK